MSDERTRPERIRVTGLQEAQLPALLELEKACAEMYHDIGFDAAEVPVRSVADIVALTRDHDVRVAEADHVVAGYVAWRDAWPGVAYLAELSVHPELQRLGVGTRLLDALRERARGYKMHEIVVRVWERATWAMAFYKKAGFVPIGEDAPGKVVHWRDEQQASGRPLTRPGEVVLWAPVGAPPADPEDDTDSAG